MRQNGFSLLELMVVIGVIALVAAITAPALIATKNKAHAVQCSSNLRQLSLGFTVYQQDNNTFPYGFCDSQLGRDVPQGGYAGNPMYDKQGLWWFNYLRSSIDLGLEPGSVLWCPSRRVNGPAVKKNLLCGNYGVNRFLCTDAQGVTNNPFTRKPVSLNQVQSPAGVLLAGDSGYALVSWLAAVQTTEPVFENSHRIDSFYLPGLRFNQTRHELQDIPDAVKGRHPHRTINVIFADGHCEVRPVEWLKIDKSVSDPSQVPSIWKP